MNRLVRDPIREKHIRRGSGVMMSSQIKRGCPLPAVPLPPKPLGPLIASHLGCNQRRPEPAGATCSSASVLPAAGVSVATGGFLEVQGERGRGWSREPFCTAPPLPPSLCLFICSNRLLQRHILPTNHCCTQTSARAEVVRFS